MHVKLKAYWASYDQRGSTQKIIDQKGGNLNKDKYFKYMKKNIGA